MEKTIVEDVSGEKDPGVRKFLLSADMQRA
jgi:hypothetical protein